MEKKAKNKQRVRLQGQLKVYMQWPAYMGVFLTVVSILCYFISRRAGILMSIVVLVYLVILVVLYMHSHSIVMKDLMDFASQYGFVQGTLLKELAVPYVILQGDGRVLWMNKQFENITNRNSLMDANISRYMPEINKAMFPKDKEEVVKTDVFYERREYRAELRKVSIEGFSEGVHMFEMPEGAEYFIAVSLQDVTELNQTIRKNDEQRMVSGLIYIDNYDEVLDSVEEVKQSLLFALVDRKINQYIVDGNGIIKKLENDKYFFAVQKQDFQKFAEDKFSVLDDVKSVSIGNSIPVTLSIGLGVSDDTYAHSSAYARVAIDLALARGGDQAVVKDSKGLKYYGGKQEQTSKNTRVKARVKAEALREFIMVREQIFIMGHKLTDVDALGAAVGIYRAAAALGKKAHIIVNEVSASLRPLYLAYMESEDYPKDMFLKSSQALAMADEESLVVVVDANRPQLTECEELLSIAKTIVVLDHHRQCSDNIHNAVLSYVEPYASSTCEMVCEILQYMVESIKIPKLEASSLYAGIMIDTNNFVNKTGVRTFEAAAFLRRAGADITLVRKMFRDDMDAYRARAEIISSAEVYQQRMAIAASEELNVESPTIIGAQAANELLDINGVKASFVLTVYHGKIYVSARSIDEVNVQIIMERLGGGGHINAAGAQFNHTDLEEAVACLKEVIDEMIEEGDI